MVASASSNRATGFDQSTPYGSLPTRSPGPIPRIARPRVIRFRVAAACAVTAGWRLPVSVTPTPRRTRLKRLRAAKLPNSVHASIAASGERNKRADAVYFGSHSGRGVWPLMWSGTQYESTRLATAAR
jgi:hypothetical protein